MVRLIMTQWTLGKGGLFDEDFIGSASRFKVAFVGMTRRWGSLQRGWF